jgi:hypothetical protein
MPGYVLEKANRMWLRVVNYRILLFPGICLSEKSVFRRRLMAGCFADAKSDQVNRTAGN